MDLQTSGGIVEEECPSPSSSPSAAASKTWEQQEKDRAVRYDAISLRSKASHYLRAWHVEKNFESIWKRSSTCSSLSRSYVLDGLRALSVLWVLSFHIMTVVVVVGLSPLVSRLVTFWPVQIIFNGDMGVDCFFVLSGYLIGRILLKDLVRGFERGLRGTASVLCTFYLRRWLRIFPMLVAAIILTVVSNEISSSVNEGKGFSVFPLSGSRCEDFGQVWPMLLFINNYLCDFYCMVQTWSVAVEFQMYLLSPFIIWMVYSFKQKRRRSYGFTMLVVLSSLNVGFNAIHIYGIDGGNLFFFIPHTCENCGPKLLPLWYVATWCRFSPYVSGLAVALMESETKQRPALPCTWYLKATDILVSLVIGSLLFLGCGTNYLTYETSQVLAQVLCLGGRWIFGWAIAYVVFMCNKGRMRVLNAMLSLPLWYPFAVLSYGAYLLHMIWVIFVKGVDPFRAISPLQSIWVSWSVFNWDFTVTVVFTFASALLTYLLVEKPFINMRPNIQFHHHQQQQQQREA
jgi:peptidoglycan/LPS O-acetylase OafA/YrhL